MVVTHLCTMGECYVRLAVHLLARYTHAHAHTEVTLINWWVGGWVVVVVEGGTASDGPRGERMGRWDERFGVNGPMRRGLGRVKPEQNLSRTRGNIQVVHRIGGYISLLYLLSTSPTRARSLWTVDGWLWVVGGVVGWWGGGVVERWGAGVVV